MDIDKFEQLKDEIRRKFEVEEEITEDLLTETADGLIKQGTADALVFNSPVGRVKLALEKRPVVLDKKFIFSHRQGQAARTEYEFSDSEFSYRLKAYQWSEVDDEWKEIDATAFS